MTSQSKQIFLSLLAVPESERERRLAEACGDDVALREDVRQLLAYAGHSGDLLDSLGEGWEPDEERPLPERLGEYEILGRLGRGATSVVYRARRFDAGVEDRDVALKVFRAGAFGGVTIGRFRAEAKSLARLDHPGIPALLDSGTLVTPEGEVPFLVTDAVDGVPLRGRARGDERVADIVALVAGLAEIMSHAHDKGVIHRDLKPDNILVDAAGRPHVLDFGLSRLMDSEPGGRSMLTRVGQVVGTVCYMSPEQAQAGPEPVDLRTDLYSLGVIAYELLAGRLPIPIPTDSLHRAIVAILTTDPTPLGEVRPECRGNLEIVVGRLLAKKPAERYGSAAELLADLRRHQAGDLIPRAASGRVTARAGRGRLLTSVLLLCAAVGGTVVLSQGLGGTRVTAAERKAIVDVVTRVGAASTQIHAERKDAGQLRQAIESLEGCSEQLAALGPGLPLQQLIRYIYWRMGEAHYFLGSMDWDRFEYARCKAAWSHAGSIPFAQSQVPPVPSTMPEYNGLMELAAYQPEVGMTLLELALAELDTPLKHARWAVESAERSDETMDVTQYIQGFVPKREVILRDRSQALNNGAGAYIIVGRLTADTTAIDSALARLGRAVALWPSPDAYPAQASLHQNRGNAWLERGRITRSRAAFDSAAAAYAQALALRPIESNPRSNLATRAAMAQLALARADADPADSGMRPLLDRASSDLRRTRSIVHPAESNPAGAVYRILQAELAIECARRGDRGGLADADSLLSASEHVITPDHFPLQYGELMRVKSRWYEVRWLTGRRPTDRQSAEECLRAALEFATVTDDPAGHRRLEQRLATLAAEN